MEGMFKGGHVIEYAAQCPNIHRKGVRLIEYNFGCIIVRHSLHIGWYLRWMVYLFGLVEIPNFILPRPSNQNIGRLNIAMDDAIIMQVLHP
jgi:hypothetical protein